ncbi:hypothetical protein [Runella sp. SP2]|uniref:hypothetical protein n=1 Tax=Runella sp. SP2 TaxID=2268026 RepID=UPI000F087D2F|nr:hypothetical protein [Runella sp. SP2]AYQ33896.1 hypothetical protein DTQ70_17825 [Runella sp. SP2]
MVVDLLTQISPIYPHDKPEGVAILSNTLIAVSNDDDFGVVDNGQNSFTTKILPATRKVDKNRIYFIKLSTPLK